MNFREDDSRLIELLAMLTRKYTSGESSSISYQKARQLMGAVQYCLNEWEQEEKKKKHPVLTGCEVNLELAYETGYQMVIKKVKETKTQYERMVTKFSDYGNQNYGETVRNAIAGFFVHYDPLFGPQNHIITMDYPVLTNLSGYCGIEAVNRYLSCIEMEQIFLRHIPEEYIYSVLSSTNSDYESSFDNVCTPILHSILASMAIGRKIQDKDEESAYYELLEWVRTNGENVIQNRLKKCLEVLVQNGYGGQKSIYRYFKEDIADFTIQLRNVRDREALSHLVFF